MNIEKEAQGSGESGASMDTVDYLQIEFHEKYQ